MPSTTRTPHTQRRDDLRWVIIAALLLALLLTICLTGLIAERMAPRNLAKMLNLLSQASADYRPWVVTPQLPPIAPQVPTAIAAERATATQVAALGTPTPPIVGQVATAIVAVVPPPPDAPTPTPGSLQIVQPPTATPRAASTPPIILPTEVVAVAPTSTITAEPTPTTRRPTSTPTVRPASPTPTQGTNPRNTPTSTPTAPAPTSAPATDVPPTSTPLQPTRPQPTDTAVVPTDPPPTSTNTPLPTDPPPTSTNTPRPTDRPDPDPTDPPPPPPTATPTLTPVPPTPTPTFTPTPAPTPAPTLTPTPVPAADLSIAKGANPNPVNTSASLAYTLSITNNGPNTAESITVIDTLPAGVTFSSATGSGWTCSENSGTVTCTRPSAATGALPPITINVTAPAAPGSLVNTATVTAATSDPDTSNNSASTTTNVVATEADLSITKADNNDPVVVGDTLRYTLIVNNAGPADASDISVIDTLPAGVTFSSATGSGWTCSENSGTVTCTRPALAAGTAAPAITIDVQPNNQGAIINSATVSATTSDPDTSNNSADQTTTVNPVPPPPPDLNKSIDVGSATPGSNATYTIEITNNATVPIEITSISDSFGYFDVSSCTSPTHPAAGTCPIGPIGPVRDITWNGSVTLNQGETMRLEIGGNFDSTLPPSGTDVCNPGYSVDWNDGFTAATENAGPEACVAVP